jgi:hypothetical protein
MGLYRPLDSLKSEGGASDNNRVFDFLSGDMVRYGESDKMV